MTFRISTAVLAGAASMALAAPAHAATVINTVVPVSVTTTTSCGDEVVHFEGTVHTVGLTTEDANGGIHFRGHVNEHLEGIGLTSGDRYVSNASETAGYGFRDESGNATAVLNLHVNRQGESTPVDDNKLHSLIHFTDNRNGEPVFVETYREACA
jgi:hypothetical protein